MTIVIAISIVIEIIMTTVLASNSASASNSNDSIDESNWANVFRRLQQEDIHAQ